MADLSRATLDLLDELARQGGLTARYLASGTAGLGSVVANPLAASANKALDALGYDYRFPDQYEAVQAALSDLGLPEPQTTLEKGVGFASELGVPDPSDSARIMAQLSHVIDPELAMALTARFNDAIKAADEGALYHSGSAGYADEIDEYGLEPRLGDWVKEVLYGATDETDLIDEIIENAPPAIWMSDKPDWVLAKISQDIGKDMRSLTWDDVRKYGHLSVIAKKDEWGDRINAWEVGENTEELRHIDSDEWEPIYQTPFYSDDGMTGRYYQTEGLEPGDIVSADIIEPAANLTGDDLVEFLSKRFPDLYKQLGEPDDLVTPLKRNNEPIR